MINFDDILFPLRVTGVCLTAVLALGGVILATLQNPLWTQVNKYLKLDERPKTWDLVILSTSALLLLLAVILLVWAVTIPTQTLSDFAPNF